VPPAKKPVTVQLPTAVRDEIADAARRTHRSVAFIVRRALAAIPKGASAVGAAGPRAPLELTTDDDDPADTVSKIKAAAGASLDDAIAAAWIATRARFQAWIAREEAAGQAERADDLDAGLRDAAAAATPVARLVELSKSEYPKIRALVAAHPQAPKEVLERLSADKEPYVRDAVENRRLKG
jgi:hypothetical protein